jgi:hypothetical protein
LLFFSLENRVYSKNAIARENQNIKTTKIDTVYFSLVDCPGVSISAISHWGEIFEDAMQIRFNLYEIKNHSSENK